MEQNHSPQQNTPQKRSIIGMLGGKRGIMRIVKIVFVVLAVFFVGQYFIRNFEDLRALDFSINWSVFFLSMLLFFVYKITLASLWHYITVLNDAAISYISAIIAYLYSILGKYIPGKVFLLAARIGYYNGEGAKLRKVTVCFFIENICTLLGAALLFILSLFFFPNDVLHEYRFVTYGLIVLFFIGIHPKILNFFLRLLEKITKKQDLTIPMRYTEMLKVVLLFVLNWMIVGIGFYILTYSIYPLPLSQALYAAGIFALSAIIGILSVFAPSGIGVREGIIVLGLSAVMPTEYAVIISIVSRLWATIPELTLVGLAFVFDKIRKRKQ